MQTLKQSYQSLAGTISVKAKGGISAACLLAQAPNQMRGRRRHPLRPRLCAAIFPSGRKPAVRPVARARNGVKNGPCSGEQNRHEKEAETFHRESGLCGRHPISKRNVQENAHLLLARRPAENLSRFLGTFLAVFLCDKTFAFLVLGKDSFVGNFFAEFPQSSFQVSGYLDFCHVSLIHSPSKER